MTQKPNKSEIYSVEMNDKICLVTGANSGIGKEATLGLAKMNAHLIMLCRSEKRGEKAKKNIIEQVPDAKLELFLCDLASFEQVREFGEKIMNKFEKLDVLINNAGVYLTDYEETDDGLPKMMEVNHFSPFLLTNLLLPLLKQITPSRILFVNSGAHTAGAIHIDDISKIKNWEKTGMRGYATSKFVQLLTTYKFDEVLQNTKITVNAYNPGMTSTNLARHSFAANIFWKIISPFIKSAEDAAEPLIYLASHPKFRDISGKYFDKFQQTQSAEKTYDKNLQNKMWEESLKVTSLKNPY